MADDFQMPRRKNKKQKQSVRDRDRGCCKRRPLPLSHPPRLRRTANGGFRGRGGACDRDTGVGVGRIALRARFILSCLFFLFFRFFFLPF